MIKLILSFAVYWLMFWLIDQFLPHAIFGFGIMSGGVLWYIFLWGVFYMINKIIKPIISFLAIPVNILTLWLVWILINIWMIYIMQYIVNGTWIISIYIWNIIQVFLLSILLSAIYKILDIIW